MKISPKQYAQGLYEELQNKSEAESIELIKNFVKFLFKQRDLNLERDIEAELIKLYQAESNEEEVEIISARPLSKEIKDMLQERFLSGKNLIISEKIDPSILGGFIIRYQDKLIDGSLKYNINLLHKQFNN